MNFHLFRVLLVFVPLVSTETSVGLTDSKEEASSFAPEYLKPPQTVKLSKFSLTQKGYIQFLRYITPVPPIGDFTFCVWMRSVNLTYSHPLLSYSMHEEERFIRAWVTPGGEEIRLAVREIDIIKVPVALKEHQWYHICQSWSTKSGHWDLFLNGKLKSHGYNTKARGIILPKDGDLVVGQEYTDFDKGLDDGIEGDIFGFNMVLASTSVPQKSSPQKSPWYQKEPTFYTNRRISSPEKVKGHYIVASGPLYLRRISKSLNEEESTYSINTSNTTEENLSSSLDSSTLPTLQRNKRQSYVYPVPYIRVVPVIPREKLIIKQINPYYYPVHNYGQSYQYTIPPDQIRQPVTPRNKNSRTSNDIPIYSPKPLGLQLVELSLKCYLGKGAPLKGKDVLISWTKTPVRVFGGAILKKIDPFCY